jgi:hypothetical protein
VDAEQHVFDHVVLDAVVVAFEQDAGIDAVVRFAAAVRRRPRSVTPLAATESTVPLPRQGWPCRHHRASSAC